MAQTRQEACDRLETTVMRPTGTRENKQTNKHISLFWPWYRIGYISSKKGYVRGLGISEKWTWTQKSNSTKTNFSLATMTKKRPSTSNLDPLLFVFVGSACQTKTNYWWCFITFFKKISWPDHTLTREKRIQMEVPKKDEELQLPNHCLEKFPWYPHQGYWPCLDKRSSGNNIKDFYLQV
jgi:hypothetical protein